MLPWKNTDLDIHAYYHENLNLGYAFLFSTKIWEENKTDLPLNFFTMLPYFYPHPKGPQFTPGPVLASLGKTLIWTSVLSLKYDLKLCFFIFLPNFGRKIEQIYL